MPSIAQSRVAILAISRNPGDLEQFVAAIIDMIENGQAQRSAAE